MAYMIRGCGLRLWWSVGCVGRSSVCAAPEAIPVLVWLSLVYLTTLALRTGLACGSPRATDGFMCHALDAKKPRSFRNGAGCEVVLGYAALACFGIPLPLNDGSLLAVSTVMQMSDH